MVKKVNPAIKVVGGKHAGKGPFMELKKVVVAMMYVSVVVFS